MKSKGEKSFTFIDVMVGTSLMLIIFLGIFGAYQLSLKVVAQSGARVTATATANQKIEEIRNLSYPEVRYTPEGEIEKIETLDDKYTINTTIIPIADSFDGLGGADNCEDTDIDYKRVKVEVLWSIYGGGEVSLITDVVPKTFAQECEEISGTLSVLVIDADSKEVAFPGIEIIDPETSVIVAFQQPSDGKYDFPLFPQQYKVKVTAFNYIDQTYGEGDIYYFDSQEATIREPEKEHPLIKTDGVENIEFQMDELGRITVETLGTEAEEYPIIPDIPFTIRGAKIVGRDLAGDPIYKYLHQDSTNQEGEKLISDLEFDSYYFATPSTLYDLSQTNPPQPVGLLPGENKIVKLILEPENSLLVTVLNASTSAPIFGASVNLSGQIRPTDGQGQAFFAPLEPDIYTLIIEATGFLPHQEQVSILEGEDKEITVELTPKLN